MSAHQLEESEKQTAPRLNVKTDRNPKRVSVRWNGEVVADSIRSLILHERGKLPVYYFPREDVRSDVLVPSDNKTYCPVKGDASYYSVKVNGEISEDAVWSYEETIPGREDIKGYYAFYWNKVDAWFEEDEEVFVHPRDPYKRIDALRSSRHVEIYLDEVKLADSKRPVIVFETGVPVRYYLPEEDLNTSLLEASELETACPYKGTASYRSVQINGELHKDIVWTYENPIPEIPQIAGLFSFYNERVQVIVDGVEQPQPRWYRSAIDFFNLSEI